ncbi:MAG: LPS export ABC transporter permease LptF [Paracoccaceae bacterium]
MARFDRYLLSQLMALFGFFALVLVAVYWVNRAVVLFDQLISDGQSAWVFLEFTALTLPNVIRLVLPIAAFFAAVYITNRLSSESELVVMQATGFSPLRLARPVLYFGLVIMLMMSVLLHVLVPASRAKLIERQGEISQNVASRFLTEGAFLHPAPGVTFFILSITPQGELRDIFLSDTRNPDAAVTYTANSALLVRADTGPKLAMFQGMAQSLDARTRKLSVTRFQDFSYDIGALIAERGERQPTPDEMSTMRILAERAALGEALGLTTDQLRLVVHDRIVDSCLGLVTALIGFAALLIGGYSRFGLWRQIALAVALLIVVQLTANASSSYTQQNPVFWPLIYAPILVGLALAFMLLLYSGRQRHVLPESPALATGARS